MKSKALLIVALIAAARVLPLQAQVSVHMINVGQAESILLEFKDQAVLIDAGGETSDQGAVNPDRDHLLAYLDAFFARRTDLHRTLYSVIVSHPHIDHTRNLMAVLDRYQVLNLVDGGDQHGSGFPQLRQAREAVAARHALYNKIPDTRISAGGYSPPWLRALQRSASAVDIRFLGGGSVANCENANNGSLVTLVTYRGSKFLFMGDAQDRDDHSACTPQLARLTHDFRQSLDVDVLKVSHHGAENGTNVDILSATTPEIALISAGPEGRRGDFSGWHHGHPREASIAQLESATSGTRTPAIVFTRDGQFLVNPNRRLRKAIYCTCWDGDIVVSVDDARHFQVRATGLSATGN